MTSHISQNILAYSISSYRLRLDSIQAMPKQVVILI